MAQLGNRLNGCCVCVVLLRHILFIMNNDALVNEVKSKKLLKEVRRKKGLTQSQLAEYLGIERARLSNLENGKAVPDWLIKALKLNSLLQEEGYSLADLVVSEGQDQLIGKNGNS